MEKEKQYQTLLKGLDKLYDKELQTTVNQLNVLASLKESLGFFWVGLYRAKPDKLVLGPYAGTLPCTKIAYESGLCGQTASKGAMHCVNDVSQLTNYSACHAETKSEIVLPGFKGNEVAFVLDIDSTEKGAFDEKDQHYLPQVAGWLATIDDQP